MSDSSGRVLRRLLPFLILIAGAAVMMVLFSQRKAPTRARPRPAGALVEVLEVQLADRRVLIEGTGSVQPRDEITLIPQVNGKVAWVHSEFEAGGRFREDEVLVRIEEADYLAAAQRAQAQVAQAEYQLQLARANAAVARREWELLATNGSMGDGETESRSQEPDPLVLHEPQLRQAEANLASAGAAAKTAELNLDRTQLRAPFNGRVRSESIALGQLVGPGAPIAVLYGTDLVEIEVGLPLADLGWIEIPGAKARVILNTGEDHVWDGHVDRSIGVLDEIGRLARIVVQVKDPFVRPTPNAPELSIGSFVTVEIVGRELQRTIPIPRRALRENNTVWIATPEKTLTIRTVKVQRLTPTEALIGEGLRAGERIISTPLAGAVPGMPLRWAGSESTPDNEGLDADSLRAQGASTPADDDMQQPQRRGRSTGVEGP